MLGERQFSWAHPKKCKSSQRIGKNRNFLSFDRLSAFREVNGLFTVLVARRL